MDVFPGENDVIGVKIEANNILEFIIMQREAKPLLIISNFCTTIKPSLLLSEGMSKQYEMSERISIFKVACFRSPCMRKSLHGQSYLRHGYCCASEQNATKKLLHISLFFFSFILHLLKILREETDNNFPFF